MARYGRDMDWNRGGMGRRGGWGRDYGNEGGYGGAMGGNEYGGFQGGGGYGGFTGGMGSDAYGGGWEDYGSQSRQGYSGFGSGGGAYDNGYGGGTTGGRSGGYGGYGGGWTGGDLGSQGGMGGGYGAYGYGGGMGGSYGTEYGTDRSHGRMGEGRGGQRDQTSQLRASDIMTENPETVTPEATLAEAARKMRDLNVGIIPVVDSEQNRRLRGVVTDRDIAIRAVADGKDVNSTTVSEVMTTDLETCNKNDSVRDIVSVMQREQVRRVPITDREGRLVGIVAQADVATELEGHTGDHLLADAVERISEPTHSRRGGQQGGMMGRGRTGGMSGGGRMSGGMNAGGMNAGGGTGWQGETGGTGNE